MTVDLVLALCFLLFIGLVFRPGKKALLNLIDGRVNKIVEDVDKLKKEHENLSDSVQELKQELKSVKQQRQEKLDHAKIEADAKHLQYIKELDHILKTKDKSIDRYINHMQDQAIKEIKKDFFHQMAQITKSYMADNAEKLASDIQIYNILLPSISKNKN